MVDFPWRRDKASPSSTPLLLKDQPLMLRPALSFARRSSLLCALCTTLFASAVLAATLTVSIGVAPAPATITVTSTAFTTPFGYQLSAQAQNASFGGGLISMWTCAAVLTVKDAAQAQLSTRVLFNGAAGSLIGTKTNPDGSQTRQYLVTNPPGLAPSYRCTTQAQVAKASGAPDIALDAAGGDLLRLEVNG